MDLLHHTIIFPFMLVNLLLSNTTVIASDDRGFSLELIHRDSIDSPLYPGNLTDSEKFERLAQSSESRIKWLESSTTIKLQDLDIRPIIAHELFTYMVRVTIGRIPVYLALDNGGSLVWTQSEPCNPCFEHDGPSYKPSESSTFNFLRINNRYCVGAYAKCKYERRYLVRTKYTKGMLATEDFSFASKTGGVETIPLAFGSSTNNSADFFGVRIGVSGFFGMGGGPLSFAMQVGHRINGRFAYCLVPITEHGVTSHLRFGYDIVIRDHYRKTPILRYPGSGWYYVALEGISINGERLNLPRGTFARHPDGVGGCIMDSGVETNVMITPAYDAVKRYLVNYFKRLNLARIGNDDNKLCYYMPPNFNDFPSMDFHFRGATLHQAREHLFYIFENRIKFCLLMTGSKMMTIIGATGQQNIHFLYDTKGGQLFFAPRNCAES